MALVYSPSFFATCSSAYDVWGIYDSTNRFNVFGACSNQNGVGALMQYSLQGSSYVASSLGSSCPTASSIVSNNQSQIIAACAGSNTVEIFSPSSSGYSLTSTLTSTLCVKPYLAVEDQSNNIYASCFDSNSLVKFTPAGLDYVSSALPTTAAIPCVGAVSTYVDSRGIVGAACYTSGYGLLFYPAVNGTGYTVSILQTNAPCKSAQAIWGVGNSLYLSCYGANFVNRYVYDGTAYNLMNSISDAACLGPITTVPDNDGKNVYISCYDSSSIMKYNSLSSSLVYLPSSSCRGPYSTFTDVRTQNVYAACYLSNSIVLYQAYNGSIPTKPAYLPTFFPHGSASALASRAGLALLMTIFVILNVLA